MNDELQPGVKRRASVRNCGNIHKAYAFDKVIGKGSYGSVHRATNIQTGQECAIKAGRKAGKRNSSAEGGYMPQVERSLSAAVLQIEREVDALSVIDHPNIVKLIDSYEDDNNVYMVMGLCSGGQVLTYVLRRDYFSEGQAAYIMRDLFLAVDYMHTTVDLIHRDLKPENLAMKTDGPMQENMVQLIDFGLCIRGQSGQSFRAQNGTLLFMAPQVVKGIAYDRSCDMWSCGVILYLLCSGRLPFQGKKSSDVEASIIRGNYSMLGPSWSEHGKDLVRGLLKMNPLERITAAEALNHKWIQVIADQAAEDKAVAFPDAILQSLHSYLTGARAARASSRQKGDEARGIASTGGSNWLRDQFGVDITWLFESKLLCCTDSDSRCGAPQCQEVTMQFPYNHCQDPTEQVVVGADPTGGLRWINMPDPQLLAHIESYPDRSSSGAPNFMGSRTTESSQYPST